VRGDALRERVCAEKLIGTAQEFAVSELEDDPIPRGIDKNDPAEGCESSWPPDARSGSSPPQLQPPSAQRRNTNSILRVPRIIDSL
jgi:hypothetical protein